MTTEALIIVIVMLIVSVAAIAMPFISARRAKRQENVITLQKARDELLTSYERVLSTIRDLDDDFQTGKLGESEYRQEREYWAEMGVRLLRQLDPNGVPGEEPAPARTGHAADQVLDDAIEHAIQQYLQAARSEATTS